MSQELVDFYAASERAGVSYWTLYRGAEAGLFKTVYLGGRRMIPIKELEYILEHGFGRQKGRGRPRSQPKKVKATTEGR